MLLLRLRRTAGQIFNAKKHGLSKNSLFHNLNLPSSQSAACLSSSLDRTNNRFNYHYTTSATLLSSSSQQQQQQPQPQPQVVATSYNNRRAAYKKAVSKLRKQYADEISQQRQQDLQAEQKQKEEQTRQRLETQRLKNIQSVKNAMRQEEHRLQKKNEFEEHLKVAQQNREAREERFVKARRLVVEELETQSDKWLTTPEEVDMALNGVEQEQKLWAKPGSFIGEALPSEDADFWRYESHTWQLQKTYPSAREKLLEQLKELIYDEANLDPRYWTQERLDEHEELQSKAKLRALVREAGRKALLLKQRELMQDRHLEENAIGTDGLPPLPPKAMAAPSLKVLADYEAMEKEGVKLLREDPTRFFVFADSKGGAGSSDDEGNKNNNRYTSNDDANSQSDESSSSSSSSSSHLGKPIRLVDPVRDSSYTGTPYPELIGTLPKADLRTEREKKREEREEKMLAAAQQESAGIEFEADDEAAFSGGDVVDYDKFASEGGEEVKEWEEGLDPVLDKELLQTPWNERYTQGDVEWIIEQLEDKVDSLEDILSLEDDDDAINVVEEGSTAGNDEKDEIEKVLAAGVDDYVEQDQPDQGGKDDYDEDELLASFGKWEDIEGVGISDLIHIEDTNSVLSTLNDEQLSVLQSLEEDNEEDYQKTAEEIKDALSKVPGLTNIQVQSLVDLELSLSKNTEIQKKLAGKKNK
mmetsp:Transcript_5313/g.6004  ORF Transcript_5313/g.6004 Transcript_5313/m.6004 type:complete len:699 (-) Transcript_5313:3-2099(-)